MPSRERQLPARLKMWTAQLLETIRDATAVQVVWRQLDHNPVARQNPDKVHPHLTGNMCQDIQAVLQFHTEHAVRQRLEYNSLEFDALLFAGRSGGSRPSGQLAFYL